MDLSCPLCPEGKKGEAGSLVCGRCQSVGYCSKDHQREHWKIHKNECSPFKIVQSQNELGLQWVATRDLMTGTLVLEEQPILYYIDWRGTNYICLTCGGPFNSRLCSTCRWPICSNKCESDPAHRDGECHVFNSQKVSFPPSSKMRKWFTKTYKKEQLEDKISTCIGLIRVLRLMKNHSKSYTKFVEALNRLGKPMGQSGNPKEVEMMGSVLKNWINLKELDVDPDWTILNNVIESFHDSDGSPVHSVFDKLSQSNHSCSPNCILESSSPSSLAVKLTTINGVKKGEELTDNYMKQDLARVNRRGRQLIILMEKGFKCQCTRCVDPTENGSYMDAITCLKCRPIGRPHANNIDQDSPNVGYLLPTHPLDLSPNSEWKCNNCGGTQTYETVLKLTDSLPHELDTILGTLTVKNVAPSLADVLELYFEYERKVGPFLHPNHFGLMMSADGIVKICERLQSSLGDLNHQLFTKVVGKVKYLMEIANRIAPGTSNMRVELQRILKMFRSLGIYQDDLSAL